MAVSKAFLMTWKKNQKNPKTIKKLESWEKLRKAKKIVKSDHRVVSELFQGLLILWKHVKWNFF